MIFRGRSTQAEYFDHPQRSEAEIAAALRCLNRVNRVFQFARPFEDLLPSMIGSENCTRLEILDVGAGNGQLAERLSMFAARKGWSWRFTNLDLRVACLRHGQPVRPVAASALHLPFQDAQFDVVLASQMTHHLHDCEVVQHLREAWRVSRDAILICDMHRNVGLYALLWVSGRLLRLSSAMQGDALISVRRGFRRPELRRLAALAGVPNARVSMYYGARIVLQASKRAPRASGARRG
jgi:SAM-dependent methyltransferase